MGRVFCPLGLVVCLALVAACGTGAGVPGGGSNVLRPGRGIAARAGGDADAMLAAVSLPAGARRVPQPSRGLLAQFSGPNLGAPYLTVRDRSAYWTVPAASVARLLRLAPQGASSEGTWSGGNGGEGAAWMLPDLGRWIGPRFLEIGALADPRRPGRWLVWVQAVVVWTPEIVNLPEGITAVVVRLLPGNRLVARESAPVRVAQVIEAVDALPVDNAVEAVFSCPEIPAAGPSAIELVFLSRAGKVLATARTDWCPQTLELSVPGSGHQLRTLNGLIGRLDTLLGKTLPVTR